MRSHGVDLTAIGTVFAPPYLLSALAGTLIAGVLADRLVRRDLNAPVRASSYALAFATACLCLACWVPSFTTVVLLTIPMGLVGGGWILPMQSTTQNALPLVRGHPLRPAGRPFRQRVPALWPARRHFREFHRRNHHPPRRP
jgi:MFS family permease